MGALVPVFTDGCDRVAQQNDRICRSADDIGEDWAVAYVVLEARSRRLVQLVVVAMLSAGAALVATTIAAAEQPHAPQRRSNLIDNVHIPRKKSVQGAELPVVQMGSARVVVKYLGHDFVQYQTRDRNNQVVTFYVSEPKNKSVSHRLVLFINGSGCDSVFAKDKDGLKGYGYDMFLDNHLEEVRVVVAEKPGVRLYDNVRATGQGCKGCSEQFLKEYTLEKWTEANDAALLAALALPRIKRDKILVIGHSDGGQVATHLARLESRVTHVASIAGGGPTQLFDSVYAASTSKSSHTSKDVEEVLEQWRDIEKDPHSITKFVWGHPYNRWSSFLKTSSLDDLLNCKTKCYLVQGTSDTSVPVASFDLLLAELAVHDRPMVYERIDSADHGLTVRADDKSTRELPNAIERIMKWFLQP